MDRRWGRISSIGSIAQLVRARSLYLRCPWFESRSTHNSDILEVTKDNMLKKKRKLTDKLLRVMDVKDESNYAQSKTLPQEMMVSGDLSLGKNGNPVTILIEDEVTGEQLEVSGVRNAFLIIEDSRKKAPGWLAMAVGSMDKMSSVLSFLSQSTLDAIKRFTGR